MLVRSEQLIRFVAILKPDVCIISGRHICAPRWSTLIWRPHCEPYKFLLHILKNNSAVENCTDVRLGQVVNLTIFIISEILGRVLFLKKITVSSHFFREPPKFILANYKLQLEEEENYSGFKMGEDIIWVTVFEKWSQNCPQAESAKLQEEGAC